MTLKTKLISAVVSISVIIILACSLFSYFSITNMSNNVDDTTANLSENVKRDVSGFAGHYAGTLIHLEGKRMLAELDHQLNTAKYDLNILKEMNIVRSGNAASIQTAFAPFVNNEDTIRSLFVATNNDTYTSYPSNVANKPAQQQKWYTETMRLKNGQFYLSDVYGTPQEQYVMISTPLYNGDTVSGMVGAEITLKPIQTALAEMKVGESGYMIVTDQNGTIIAHPDEDWIQKSATELPFYQSTTDQGKILLDIKQVSYLPLTQEQSGWTVLPVIPMGEIHAFTAKISQNMSKQIADAKQANAEMLKNMVSVQGIVMIILIGLSVLVSWLMARYFIRPINALSKFMERVSNGDLTEKMNVKSKDEIGKLLLSVNKMVDSLREIANKINVLATDVSKDSLTLQEQSDVSGNVSRVITDAMEEVASGAELLSSDLVHMSEYVNGSVSSIDNMNQNLAKIAKHSRETKGASEQGKQAMENMSGNMQTIVSQSNESTRLMQSLDNRLQQISEITKMIQDISEQTNLLSLNASIEAAQAGEHGRGFAVVAQEVKNLAQQSSASVDRVSSLITEIQRDSKQNLEYIEQNRQSIEEGERIVQQSEQSFEQISHFIEYLTRDIEALSEESEKLTEGSREILESIERITGISQTTTAGVQEVNGTTHEQDTSIKKVKEIASNLRQLTEQLHESTKQFKL
ncbi:methyl-accepting chemotaxis protein [Bacillus tianshenii]|nr:methyl-accepting chemotaxis protein [Bacillus tianshenii]